MQRRTTTDGDSTIPQTATITPRVHMDLGYATPLRDFKTASSDEEFEHRLEQASYLQARHAGHPQMNTEEFCALLRQESYDIDECIFEAASWQQQRKFQDWMEDVVDEMKEKGILRKPSLFEYTWFTVSTIGAVAGWVAGGPIGSVIGSKTASVAVGVGFTIKEVADKYVQKVGTKEQPVPVFELSHNAGDSLLAQADVGSDETMGMSKFEMDQQPADLQRTALYSTTAR